ncbi:hypothetical protein GOP80_06970 [Planococcaceae bacterium Storch 2/2-2]|nr:hypothetical protein [Planococcaceae bacterium Storch 2/2-2]
MINIGYTYLIDAAAQTADKTTDSPIAIVRMKRFPMRETFRLACSIVYRVAEDVHLLLRVRLLNEADEEIASEHFKMESDREFRVSPDALDTLHVRLPIDALIPSAGTYRFVLEVTDMTKKGTYDEKTWTRDYTFHVVPTSDPGP